jgi:hypothetical protein
MAFSGWVKLFSAKDISEEDLANQSPILYSGLKLFANIGIHFQARRGP